MTRIRAAALCCLLFGVSVALTSCGTVEWLSERQRDRQDDTSQGALEYLRDSKK